MRLLVDTHCWLWMQAAPGRLPETVRDHLEDGGNELMLSAASSWEIAIKYALGKLPLAEPPAVYVPSRMRLTGMSGLAIDHTHTLRVAELPRHHGNPVDRLLIAQAQLEKLKLVTADRSFAPYDVDLLPVW